MPQPIHPFPARMAPEIALEETAMLRKRGVILDPMSGSGTVLRTAADHGHSALGFDMDPLAVLMARVWTTPIDAAGLEAAATDLVRRASARTEVNLPWIDDHTATREFVNYWFGQQQQADLRRLSHEFGLMTGPTADALRIAFSRLIISKNRGASLAFDVSHSRPHRVMTESDYQVMPNFLRSVRQLSRRLAAQPPPGNVQVRRGDARNITEVGAASVDAVVTSPPYLNAIDYIRGHKMTLVWFGHQCSEFRTVRTESVGAERRPRDGADLPLAAELIQNLDRLDALPQRWQRIVERFALDIHGIVQEAERVLVPCGKAVFVIGNSCLRGVFIENSKIVQNAAERVGLVLVRRRERSLPRAKRYLPPPREGVQSETETTELGKRMSTEIILSFRKPAREE